MEVFKPIPNYEGLYEISNMCRVKALPKHIQRNGFGIKATGESIKSINSSNQVCLFKDKKRQYLCVKKLYMLVFGGTEIINTKYNSLTFSGATPILTTQRKIVAEAKRNQKTKKCKLTGVSLNTSTGKKYQASIEINKKNIYLGYFNSETDANVMYLKAEKYKYLYQGSPKVFRERLHSVVL